MDTGRQQGGGRSYEWERLRSLLASIESGGLGSLTDQELADLPGLYRKALSDLSLLRSRNDSPLMVQELSYLCNKAHGVIYQRRRGKGVSLWVYLRDVLPWTVRRCSAYIWVAAGIMAVFAVLGWLHYALNPELAHNNLAAVGPNLLKEWEQGLRGAQEMADLRLAAQIPEGMRTFAAFQITLNNIIVGTNAFVFGIAGGVPAAISMGFNGYLLGAVAYLYFNTPAGIEINLPLYFIAGIAPHGGIELPAICVAGGAGLMLGLSWLFPGQRTRKRALAEAARKAGRLALVTMLTLLAAGAIEGFITPLYPPQGVDFTLWFWLKIAFGLVVFALWLLWLLAGGRGPRARNLMARL